MKKKFALGIAVESMVPSMLDGVPPVTREMMFAIFTASAGPRNCAVSPLKRLKTLKL